MKKLKHLFFVLPPALILLVVNSLTARAEPDWESLRKLQSPRIVGKTLVIQGRIDSHIYDYLSREAKAIKDVEIIELNSLGGNSEWGLTVAQKIKSLGKKTFLRSGNVCASACVYLFAAGRERIADADTWLGVHGARFGAGFATKFAGLCFLELEDKNIFEPRKKGCQAFLDEWYQAAMKATLEAFAFMESNGISPKLREAYFAMEDDPNWPEDNNVIRKPDWVLPATEAVNFGLVTSLNK